MKIYICGCQVIPIPDPSKKTQDPYKHTGGNYQRPEREGIGNAKEGIDYIHEKTGEHHRGKREPNSVDSRPDSTETMDLEDSQNEATRYKSEEEEACERSEERSRKAKSFEGYRAAEGKEES